MVSPNMRYRVRVQKGAKAPKDFVPETLGSLEEAKAYGARWKSFDEWGEIHGHTSGRKQTYEEIQSGARKLTSMKLYATTLDVMDTLCAARGGINRTELVEQLVAEESARHAPRKKST